MTLARAAMAVTLMTGLGACGVGLRRYDGPKVTEVLVQKGQRKLFLLHGDQVLKQVPIRLGKMPVGPKHFYGDMKTPEGSYTIDRRYASRDYYLALGLSYPDARDVAYAKARGKDPGGDIFIHGQDGLSPNQSDWTAGCIAVSNGAMRTVYAMVQKGTPIVIDP